MTPEDRDQNRREIVRGLEHQDRDLEAKAEKAEADAAQFRRQREDLQAARLRAQGSASPADECEACWIMHGRRSKLKAVPHEDPDHWDRLQCEDRDCGYFEDIRIGG